MLRIEELKIGDIITLNDDTIRTFEKHHKKDMRKKCAIFLGSQTLVEENNAELKLCLISFLEDATKITKLPERFIKLHCTKV